MISILDVFSWWYAKSPKKIYSFIISTIRYIYHSFSIPYMFKTLFAPWKRDISTSVNPNLQEMFNAFVNNLVARFIGFVVRSITIIIGLMVLIISSVILLKFMIFWLFWPILIIVSFVYGITIILF